MPDLAAAFSEIALGFGALLGAPYWAGRVIDQVDVIYDDGGSIESSRQPVLRDCMVQVDVATQRMREAEGYASTDVAIIILAATLTGTLDTDAVVEVLEGPHAGRWMVSLIERDSAALGWAGRGRRG
ncbi:hypothetical protein [Sphingobium sp. BS19]|uniref:hypothetical protein n=1 Tax=Sphingobium sp. BS19 TaxID=3018973 RepID=UPI0022EDD201|nr:hypothetical protein [Sphingobium sp. BS19]GLI99125.1 hypothetical protein Sbs19_29430 [Sphingobium sp. BS19]